MCVKCEINVEIYDVFSIELCRENKNKLFVFGDNLQRIGMGGQAIIRKQVNSFGIATKRLPSMSKNSFFSDNDINDLNAMNADIEKLVNLINNGSYSSVVFPLYGLGTGLAMLDKKAPRLFNNLNDRLQSYFGIVYKHGLFRINK